MKDVLIENRFFEQMAERKN